jgi:hypothetical protein
MLRARQLGRLWVFRPSRWSSRRKADVEARRFSERASLLERQAPHSFTASCAGMGAAVHLRWVRENASCDAEFNLGSVVLFIADGTAQLHRLDGLNRAPVWQLLPVLPWGKCRSLVPSPELRILACVFKDCVQLFRWAPSAAAANAVTNSTFVKAAQFDFRDISASVLGSVARDGRRGSIAGGGVPSGAPVYVSAAVWMGNSLCISVIARPDAQLSCVHDGVPESSLTPPGPLESSPDASSPSGSSTAAATATILRYVFINPWTGEATRVLRAGPAPTLDAVTGMPLWIDGSLTDPSVTSASGVARSSSAISLLGAGWPGLAAAVQSLGSAAGGRKALDSVAASSIPPWGSAAVLRTPGPGSEHSVSSSDTLAAIQQMATGVAAAGEGVTRGRSFSVLPLFAGARSDAGGAQRRRTMFEEEGRGSGSWSVDDSSDVLESDATGLSESPGKARGVEDASHSDGGDDGSTGWEAGIDDGAKLISDGASILLTVESEEVRLFASHVACATSQCTMHKSCSLRVSRSVGALMQIPSACVSEVFM